MRSAGDTTRARNRAGGVQRKKKQSRFGAVRSTTRRPDVQMTKQIVASCAVRGKSRNSSISFITLPLENVRTRQNQPVPDPVARSNADLHDEGIFEDDLYLARRKSLFIRVA